MWISHPSPRAGFGPSSRRPTFFLFEGESGEAGGAFLFVVLIEMTAEGFSRQRGALSSAPSPWNRARGPALGLGRTAQGQNWDESEPASGDSCARRHRQPQKGPGPTARRMVLRDLFARGGLLRGGQVSNASVCAPYCTVQCLVPAALTEEDNYEKPKTTVAGFFSCWRRGPMRQIRSIATW